MTSLCGVAPTLSFLIVLASSMSALGCSASPAETDTNAPAEDALESAAPLGFICECAASGPGVEDKLGRKECSYGCSCDLLGAQAVTKTAPVTIGPLLTTAYSFESWDRGSHICHGQYAWRPTLSSPNWQIEVKFSRFKISQVGNVSYGGQPVETSTNVSETFRRSEEAPEIRDALAQRFGLKASTTK